MKVLVADDESVSRRLLESSLTRWGYEVTTAKNGVEALRLLRAPDAPRLAVLDWMMPDIDGLQLCRDIRARGGDDYTYVILLTVKDRKSDAIIGLEGGADDYMVKPFDPQELKVRLRSGKRIVNLLEQLVAAREALRDLAARDPLTRLWNRGAILEIFSKELSRSQRQGVSLGVVMLDLDHFKRVNDTYGHLVGDELLREAAAALGNSLRPYDSLGRFGGEEFIVVLPGCDPLNAVSHAERLRNALSRVRLKTLLGELRVTASFGVTVASPTCADINELIRAADAAMYRAKEGGRDRVEFNGVLAGVGQAFALFNAGLASGV